MAKRKPDHAAEDSQPPLVPMSQDEVSKAGRTLAAKIRELEEMEADHGEERKMKKAERDSLRGSIAAIASTIRAMGR